MENYTFNHILNDFITDNETVLAQGNAVLYRGNARGNVISLKPAQHLSDKPGLTVPGLLFVSLTTGPEPNSLKHTRVALPDRLWHTD